MTKPIKKINQKEILSAGAQLLSEEIILNEPSLDFKFAQGSCASAIDEAVRWLNNCRSTNRITIPGETSEISIKISWERQGQLATACISDEDKARILGEKK